MARKLSTFVFLREPGALTLTSFGPESDLPDWAEKMLEGKDHLFDGGETVDSNQVDQPLPRDRNLTEVDYAHTGEAVGSEPAATEQGKSQLASTEDEDDEEPASSDQPRGNASREAWAIFAEENGVPVTEEMGRDDIKAACSEAGVLD